MALSTAELDEQLDEAWERLDEGEAAAALEQVRAARPRARLEADEVRAELDLVEGLALVDLCRFDEARRALEAFAREYEDAWAEHALGLLAERRGDRREAERRFRRARSLAPEEFPPPVAFPATAFDEAVEAALVELPEPVRRWLANVAIVVDEVPSDDDLLGAHPPHPPSILGIFRGAPLGDKASMDPWSHFPSSIVLYQKNLERFARSREELVEEIRITLLHEVGHFLGLDEEELAELGLE